jgi:16S rRNA (adenine1518-N6/adenine1519-N6)-dimethyltransferase
VKISQLREILDRRGLHLSRDLGQNFLVDEQQAHRLAALAGVRPGDTVIEVGTGLGSLTRALVACGARVVTVEVDAGVVRALREEELLPDGVELIHADALELDIGELADAADGPVRLVANLPYSAATPLLRTLLDLRDKLVDWSVMLQRELAQRLVASPGTKDYSSFTVLHQLTVDVYRAMELSARCFFPAPKVDSTFLQMTPRRNLASANIGAEELAAVERVVRVAFAQRRKTMMNGLLAGDVARGGRAQLEELYRALDLDAKVRAEMLSPGTFLAIARELARSEDPTGRPEATAPEVEGGRDGTG